MRLVLPPVCLLLVVALCPPAAQAAESYEGCQHVIPSLPAVLTSPGVWCLKGDLSTGMTTGAAITIAANNVTLDCNHFRLGGLSAGLATGTFGVWTNGRSNTAVRNCNIRGFYIGIFDQLGYGHVFEDNRLEGMTYSGIYATGSSSEIRGNRVIDTGGSTTSNGSAIGIRATEGTDVLDNTIDGVVAVGTDQPAYGIYTQTLNASVARNRIRGVQASGTAITYYIYNSDSMATIISDNDLLAYGNNANKWGIRCFNATGTAAGNRIAGFETPVHNCTSLDNQINIY